MAKSKQEEFLAGLSLSALDNPLDMYPEKVSIAEIRRKREEKVQRYKEQYGDDWWNHYALDEGIIQDYDVDLKTINRSLYHGGRLTAMGIDGCKLQQRWEERRKQLYGDRYDILKQHDVNDPEVNELLIHDALKTGKWKELPDELQNAYHERVGEKA